MVHRLMLTGKPLLQLERDSQSGDFKGVITAQIHAPQGIPALNVADNILSIVGGGSSHSVYQNEQAQNHDEHGKKDEYAWNVICTTHLYTPSLTPPPKVERILSCHSIE